MLLQYAVEVLDIHKQPCLNSSNMVFSNPRNVYQGALSFKESKSSRLASWHFSYFLFDVQQQKLVKSSTLENKWISIRDIKKFILILNSIYIYITHLIGLTKIPQNLQKP